MGKWRVNERSPLDKGGGGIYTAEIDYRSKRDDHAAKIEVHDADPDKALGLAYRIKRCLDRMGSQ